MKKLALGLTVMRWIGALGAELEWFPADGSEADEWTEGWSEPAKLRLTLSLLVVRTYIELEFHR